MPANDPYAGGVQVNGFPQGSFVVPRGGSVTTHALTANVSYQGTWPGDPSCIKGSGSVTVQAAASPSPPSPTPSSSGSSTGTGTGTSSSSSTSTPKATTKSTTATTAPTSSPSTSSTQSTAAPDTVVADTITVAGKNVTLPEGQSLTIKQSQPMVLSGTTIPNGKITLTIHSNPITATVQANASGNWSYTVTGLPSGNHSIFAAVTNPATNQTSATSKLMSFTIGAAPVASITHANATPAKKKSSILVPLVTIVLALVVIAAAIALLLKMKKKRNISVPSPARPSVTAAPSDSQQQGSIEQPTPPMSTTPQDTQSPIVPDTNGSDENHKEQS